MRTRVMMVLLLAAFAQHSCAKEGSDHSSRQPGESQPRAASADQRDHAAHTDEPDHAALPTRIRLDARVIAAAKIETAPVKRELLATIIELPGEIASDPDKTAKVSALVSGRIDSVTFREGQSVKKGDVLVVMKVPDLGKAKALYTATAAKGVAARSNAVRLQALSEQRLAATQEVLAATAEADALEAEAGAADEQLRALGTVAAGTLTGSQLSLRAPISGVIVSRDAVVGQPVAPAQTIAIIADLTQVWFLGRVFENNLGQVHVGAPAEIRLNAYPKETFDGTVEYLGKQIDPIARTIVARIQITNRQELLRLGLFGVARVGTDQAATSNNNKPPVIVVPRSAITEVGGKPVVFVQQPDGDFDLHEIVVGDGALGKVQVLNGLREGERVVVEGVFTLKSAVLKGNFGEEH
jgi:cobalt-zinc-cadmium efflux system membrane fusion protein